jgi:4-hydroxyphenylpyruvate dioxygenase-like putative hemolysin
MIMTISTHFDHVAFATNDTKQSQIIFNILGFQKALFNKQKLEKFGAYITKLQSNNGQVIELVEPASSQSVVSSLLKNREAGIYHLAFYSSNLRHTIDQLKAAGAVVVTEPMQIPYPATNNHKNYKTSHLFHPHVGLFEITGPEFG